MSEDVIISLYDHSGNMVRPWAENGYKCYCIDIQNDNSVEYIKTNSRIENGRGSITYLKEDLLDCDLNKIFERERERVGLVFCFSPCTNLAVSGARWFKGKGLKGLIRGLSLFEIGRAFIEDNGYIGFCENPVSTLSTYYRKPDFTFNPNEYAGYLEDGSDEQYTKKTCLWAFNGFKLPPKKPLEPVLGSKMHTMVFNPNERSLTPKGFAKAVYEYYRELI